jgi:hypothetical protein
MRKKETKRGGTSMTTRAKASWWRHKRHNEPKGRADIGEELEWVDLVAEVFLLEGHLARQRYMLSPNSGRMIETAASCNGLSTAEWQYPVQAATQRSASSLIG